MDKIQKVILALVVIALIFSLVSFYLSSSLSTYRLPYGARGDGGGQVGVIVLPQANTSPAGAAQ